MADKVRCYDIVGVFCQVTRKKEGDPQPKIVYRDIVLDPSMPVVMAEGFGMYILDKHVLRRAQRFISTTGLTRRWLVSWHVNEVEVIENEQIQAA